MRRIIDLLAAMLCLIVFGPWMLLIAILIKLDSAGSVLYTPKMVGQHGKVFSLFRFRTLSMDDLDAEQRLTRIGRFLRNYSLDHLPMLINLLIGDLTLVGPRPMEEAVVDFRDKTWQDYFTLKPGLMNYAVFKMGRLWTPGRISHPTLNQELEFEYIRKRSAAFDLQLLREWIWGLITSAGNIKARGEPDPDVERKMKNGPD